MIDITELLSYLPNQHGEHGVDATLHMLFRGAGPLNEVFVNPPGGSWAQFDLIRPESQDIYRWDHIPRAHVASVKRPDLVLQLNDCANMHLLSLESKLNVASAEQDMAERLTRHFVGAQGFIGLQQRPAWHRMRGQGIKPEVIEGLLPTRNRWEVIPPDEPDNERYWFRDYPDAQVTFWSGFAYALRPEIYAGVDTVRKDLVGRELEQLMRTHHGLDVVIAVGWAGEFHEPFLLRRCSSRFTNSEMSRGLDKHLQAALLE